MSKIPPKRFAILCHKMAILSALQLEIIDELAVNSETSLQFKELLKGVELKCEEVTSSVFGVEEIAKSTYIQELSSKVDTCIRKNHVIFK